MKKRIHVDQHAIRRNQRRHVHAPLEPPISVKTYKDNTKCFEVEIQGPSKVIYSPSKPLSCGARLWIETDAEVVTR